MEPRALDQREDDEEFDEVVAQLVEGGAMEIAEHLAQRVTDAIEMSATIRQVDLPWT